VRLDGPGDGTAVYVQPLAEAVHRLVMERVDGDRAAPQQLGEQGAGDNLDGVRGLASVLGLAMGDLVADDLGEMLVQGASQRDIERLRTPADAQDREPVA